jgi:Zn-finger nucleic acid-binding protein
MRPPVSLPRMTCPKCQGEMRTYERNGVHIDQCGDCRGLFLDRGELERLVDAEGSFYQQQQQQPAAPRHEERHEDHGSYDFRGKHYKKRKKHFLEELFD